MDRLKYIEDSFVSLPLRVKIELYLFPLILVFLFIFFIYDSDSTKAQIQVLKPIILKDIKMKTTLIEISKQIESFANKNKIELQTIKSSDNRIELLFYDSLEKRLKFLKYLEEYNAFSKIESMQLEADKLYALVNFDRFYKKDKIDIKEQLQIISTKRSKRDYILKAVVADSVFINDSWFYKDDIVDSYSIKRIEANRVILDDGYTNLVLKLHHYE